MMKITSIWSGKYAKSYHGVTYSSIIAIWWFVLWSVLEIVRVCKLNKYHYGNIIGFGKRITDVYERKYNGSKDN